ncbi:dolichyl-diphosphooligosaccharide--protein glycosyltransferase subunit 2 isoform X2 [Amyelois transitella]|uniref:dolichyl-diphosphooligosaccharide--protein glycosyltransferase subunit 2 isoform X2 n=1 Tax=Amyelois transitella TaxID=680683 RepID=UPI0029906606|nr:dolichyl-diphosphooligosaccharide--protein glycosyltransferase subunit 2 isoform X2 [Amyelois transitella]
MHFYGLLLFAVSLLAFSNASTLQGTIDEKKLQLILQEGLKSKDIVSLYYSIKGLKSINVAIPNVCQEIRGSKYDLRSVEQVFYLTNAAALSGCQNVLTPDVMNTPTQILDKKDATLQELYYAVYSLKALGKGSIYDKEDGLKNLIQVLKKDDSPANYGYLFALCEHMGCGDWSTSHAEGVLLAADESDGKALHFEGGLPATSMLLSTIARAYKSQKKPSPLTAEQKLKFAEYLLSRRSVNSPKGAALLLEAAYAVANDEPTPIAITIKGKKYVTAETDNIEISITDLLQRPVKGLKPEDVIAQSGTRLADDVVVLSKQPLTQRDATTFVLNLNKIKSQYGLYKIALSAGSKTASLNVAVLGEIQVTNCEVGLGDVDGTTSPKITNVPYPEELLDELQADHMQKLSLKFTVRDRQSKPVSVQQAFVRVGDRGREAVFVAEPDNAKAYRVELNVGAIGKHLGHQSGAYQVSIFLGDSAVSNPIAWDLGEIHFKFEKEPTAVARSPAGPLPEIRHQFREASPRPARAVSDVFAAACAAPLALLLLLWARLGINFGNFPLTLSALVFHLSLGASLSLYGVFWLRLTMFDTVRYLLPLAALSFLSGHRLLRRLVRDKQSR